MPPFTPAQPPKTQSAQLEPLALFKELAQLPTFNSASFLQRGRALHVGYSQKLHHREAKISLTQDLKLDQNADLKLDVQAAPLQEVPKATVEFFSADGALKGLLVTREDERYVEVWDLERTALKFARKVTKEVGEFVADEQWGQPQFSPYSAKLLFTAHPAPPSPSAPPKSALEKFKYEPNWGELQKDLAEPTIFIVDFENLKAVAVRTLIAEDSAIHAAFKDNCSVGQAQFARDRLGEGVVCTGFEHQTDGRKLGVVYCTNRPSAIWFLSLKYPNRAERLSADGRSARSPRVIHDGLINPFLGNYSSVVYLSNPLGGAHNSCSTLHYSPVDLSDSDFDLDVLVEPVGEPKGKTDFPGIYCNSLPPQPFVELQVEGGDAVVFSSTFRSRTALYSVKLPRPGRAVLPTVPRNWSLDSPDESWTVLNTDGTNKVAVVKSSLTSVPRLEVLQYGCTWISDPKDDEEGHYELKMASRWGALQSKVSKAAAEALTSLTIRTTALPGASHVETLHLTKHDVFIQPVRKLLLMPHGGPHSTSINAFSASTAAFASAGYECALVNYSGSLGFGERNVQSLVGMCGVKDVADCWQTLRVWKGKLKAGQKAQVFVNGGSHGGFLAAHLTAKYPSEITAAILRNPVISLGDVGASDIPDWYYAELGLPFSVDPDAPVPAQQLTTPMAEQYKFMHLRSPIANVHAVEAHTLVLLGDGDRRVPPAQGKSWYHALSALSYVAERGIDKAQPGFDVACLSFPGEGHALDGAAAELGVFEGSLEWLNKYALSAALLGEGTEGAPPAPPPSSSATKQSGGKGRKKKGKGGGRGDDGRRASPGPGPKPTTPTASSSSVRPRSPTTAARPVNASGNTNSTNTSRNAAASSNPAPAHSRPASAPRAGFEFVTTLDGDRIELPLSPRARKVELNRLRAQERREMGLRDDEVFMYDAWAHLEKPGQTGGNAAESTHAERVEARRRAERDEARAIFIELGYQGGTLEGLIQSAYPDATTSTSCASANRQSTAAGARSAPSTISNSAGDASDTSYRAGSRPSSNPSSAGGRPVPQPAAAATTAGPAFPRPGHEFVVTHTGARIQLPLAPAPRKAELDRLRAKERKDMNLADDEYFLQDAWAHLEAPFRPGADVEFRESIAQFEAQKRAEQNKARTLVHELGFGGADAESTVQQVAPMGWNWIRSHRTGNIRSPCGNGRLVSSPPEGRI